MYIDGSVEENNILQDFELSLEESSLVLEIASEVSKGLPLFSIRAQVQIFEKWFYLILTYKSARWIENCFKKC